MKSTVDEIRARFDAEVERFSNLETGQSATVDAPLALDLVAEAAARTTPQARRLLDVGCGAGNYTLKTLHYLPGLEVTLVDLSLPMLDRAEARIRAAGASRITTRQADIRELEIAPDSCDLILAAAVLHHLRSDEEWRAVFGKFHRALAPGGSLWIFDLVQSDIQGAQEVLWRRYGDYLASFKGAEYRDNVFAYIDREDTPRSLPFQLDLLRQAGFTATEVLHKNSCFAAFGAVKS